MGSSASKAAQTSARRYPSRASNLPPPSAATSKPPPLASNRRSPAPNRAPAVKDEAIRLDSMDPSPPTSGAGGLADRLRQIGAVRPNPTLSHSSTAGAGPASSALLPARNTTLSALDARRALQRKADREAAEAGRAGFPGRGLAGVAALRDVLVMRAHGVAATEIEARLGLRPGTVARLGPRRAVGLLGEGGAAS
ncbi:hypothetical protein RB595_003165 [Gaeumannomyces hyphopodioides]